MIPWQKLFPHLDQPQGKDKGLCQEARKDLRMKVLTPLPIERFKGLLDFQFLKQGGLLLPAAIYQCVKFFVAPGPHHPLVHRLYCSFGNRENTPGICVYDNANEKRKKKNLLPILSSAAPSTANTEPPEDNMRTQAYGTKYSI